VAPATHGMGFVKAGTPETGVASLFAGPLSSENAATAIIVPIVKLDFVGLCRALDLVGLCHFVGLRRGSFKGKLAASPA
jgi:hypothetical protein